MRVVKGAPNLNVLKCFTVGVITACVDCVMPLPSLQGVKFKCGL